MAQNPQTKQTSNKDFGQKSMKLPSKPYTALPKEITIQKGILKRNRIAKEVQASHGAASSGGSFVCLRG